MNSLFFHFCQVGPDKDYKSNLTSVPDRGKVKLSLCLTKHLATKRHWGREATAPRILNLGIISRWVVSFTTRPL